MKLRWILIAIIIGSTIITLITYYFYGLGFIDLRAFVTTVIAEALVTFLAGVLGHILSRPKLESKAEEVVKAISKESQKLKEKEELLKHSKLLVDKNLRFRINTYVGFTYQYELNLSIKGEPSLVDAPDYQRYLRETDEHLESGYWDEVWKHKEERDSLIKDHNSLAQPFLERTFQEIIDEVEKRIPLLTEWDGSHQAPSAKYVVPQYLLFDIGYALQYSYERIFDIDEYCYVKQEGNKWKISINQVFAESDNEDEMQQFKLIIKTILDDSLVRENVKKLVKYKQNIVEKHRLFTNGITEIIKDIENDIPLKGQCKICKRFSNIP